VIFEKAETQCAEQRLNNKPAEISAGLFSHLKDDGS